MCKWFWKIFKEVTIIQKDYVTFKKLHNLINELLIHMQYEIYGQ